MCNETESNVFTGLDAQVSPFVGFPTIDGRCVYIKYREVVEVHPDYGYEKWCVLKLSNGHTVQAAVTQDEMIKQLAALTSSQLPRMIAPSK